MKVTIWQCLSCGATRPPGPYICHECGALGMRVVRVESKEIKVEPK